MKDEDPGWLAAVRKSWPILVPWLGFFLIRRRSRASDMGGLIGIRLVFSHIVLYQWLFLIVLILLNEGYRTHDDSLGWPLFVAAVGLSALAGVAWARSRPLSTENPAALAASYRGMFYIAIGLAQSAALFGFVVVFITYNIWVYVEGMAFSLIGLWLIAPTRRELERRQAQIQAQGSSLSLVAALLELPPPSRPRA